MSKVAATKSIDNENSSSMLGRQKIKEFVVLHWNGNRQTEYFLVKEIILAITVTNDYYYYFLRACSIGLVMMLQ